MFPSENFFFTRKGKMAEDKKTPTKKGAALVMEDTKRTNAAVHKAAKEMNGKVLRHFVKELKAFWDGLSIARPWK